LHRRPLNARLPEERTTCRFRTDTEPFANSAKEGKKDGMARTPELTAIFSALLAFGATDFASTISTCQKGDLLGKGCGFAQSITYSVIERTTDWIDKHPYFFTAAAIVIAVVAVSLWLAAERFWNASQRPRGMGALQKSDPD
jgi:hypothetical protein